MFVLLFALLVPVVATALDIVEPTVWEGRVSVSEPVFVKVGGALTVKPGTDVLFTGTGRIEFSRAAAGWPSSGAGW